MRNVPYLLAREINRIDTHIEPVMFADIYHMREGEDSLSTEYRLRGLGDVSLGEDANISYNNATKSLLLTEGTARALDTSGAYVGGVTLNWLARIVGSFTNDKILTWTCQASIFGQCVAWTPDYKVVHHYFKSSQISYPPRTDSWDFTFVNKTTKMVHSLCVGLGNAAGTLPAVVTFSIIDPETGTPVCDPVSTTLAAGAALSKITVGGAMAAHLFGGRTYTLRVTVTPAAGYTSLLLTSWDNPDRTYGCVVSVTGLDQAGDDWLVKLSPTQNLGVIALGGEYAYSETGTVVRNLDMGTVPAIDGVFGWSSNVPLGTGIVLTALYATNSSAVASESTTIPAHWTLIDGPYSDGMSIPAYQFLRAVFTLTPNVARDSSPQLADVTAMYSGTPLVVGTISGAVSDASGNRKVLAIRALNSVSASSQSLDPKLKTTMTGEMTLELAPEPEVISLAGMKLRGVRVVVRAGINGVNETIKFYSGIIRDIAYAAGRYVLTLHDPVQIADTSIPNVRHPDWDAVTTYNLGELVVFGDKAYRSFTANPNLNHAVTDAAWWAAYPSVWIPMTYLAGTHLADIALDLLTNRINLADRYIDANSIDILKSARPTRTILADRTFDQPAKARELLDELALLLEAQWVMREGRLALLADPDPAGTYVDTLTKHDIKEGVEWRRGFADLKNEVLVLSGYSLSGSSEQYNRGQAIVDEQSVQDYRITSIQEIKDRFGLAEAELADIGANYVAKWKDGRRLIRCDAWFGKLAIEAGDVVRLISGQLPASEPQDLKCMVVQSSLDWSAMSNKITLMEV
ncbi:MAG: hypothetical protein C0406_00630 [Sideroxydans sp.]|nr:hypothetical protein [Sideroxydans sp.]